jgi:hypothetical protein
MEMQEEDGWWKITGRKFEEFKPTGESKVPTEWLIPVYAVRRLFRWSRSGKRAKGESNVDENSENIGDGERDKRGVDGGVKEAEKTTGEVSEMEKEESGIFSRLRGRRAKKEAVSV